MAKKKPGAGDGENDLRGISRRAFLRYTGITGVVAATAPQLMLVACREDGDDTLGIDVSALAIEWSVRALRAEDMLVLDFGFVNLRKESSSPPRLVRSTSGPALIVLTLPPQHLFEQTFAEQATPPAAGTPAGTALSQRSRLVFAVPASISSIEYSTSGLLTLCNQIGLNVNSNAVGSLVDPHAPGTVSGGSPGAPRAPHELETSIELPARLQLSPNQYGRFKHAVAPVQAGNRTELWHTRLGASLTAGANVDERSREQRRVRALWSVDYVPPSAPDVPDAGVVDRPPPPSFRTPLSVLDRQHIVAATADFSTSTPPQAVQVKQLALSALGGWIDAELDVPPPGPGGLERWLQRSAMGRDTHVEVVTRGFVFPFGHKASLLKIIDRRFAGTGTGRAATLFERYIVVIREPIRHYPELPADGARHSRAMPFKSIRFITTVSPTLANAPAESEQTPFLPQIEVGPDRVRVPFGWECEAIDRRDRPIKITPAIVWTPDASGWPTADSLLNRLYWPQVIATGGQRIALAPPRDADDTAFESQSLRFHGAPLANVAGAAQWPPFYPELSETEIEVDALRVVTGGANRRVFMYPEGYLSAGFGAGNPREVFLELVERVGNVAQSPIVADFARQADKAGGFMTPSLVVRGLSRLTGPVSEIGAAALQPVAKAQDVFKEIDGILPKIFGCVPLSSIIGGGVNGEGAIADLTPRFVTETLTMAERLIASGQRALTEIQRLRTLPAATEAALTAHADAIRSKAAAVHDSFSAVLGELSDLQQDLRKGAAIEASEIERIAALLPDDWFPFEPLAAALAHPLTTRLGTALPGYEMSFRLAERLARDLDELVPRPPPPPGAAAGARSQPDVESVRAAIRALARGLELVRDGNVHLEWRPTIRGFGPFVPDSDRGLVLSADLRTRSRGEAKAGVDLVCSLEGFTLDLRVIDIGFHKLQFRQRAGKKPEIDVILRDIVFKHELEFVERLKSIIPLDGFSDPPHVDVTPSGLSAGYSLALPDIAVGMFSLEHVAISADLEVPFLGDSIAFHFGFCSRENPFVVTVAMLGGGGFFGLSVSPKGVIAIEAAIEFGARLSMNVFIASGCIEVMGGIYFAWFDVGGMKLTGYLRLRGEVDVLGLISASIELRLELTYQDDGSKKVSGSATLEIEVSLAFFSKKFSTTVERKFAGANGDPTFEQMVGPYPDDLSQPHPWLDYWESFAALAA